MQYGLTDLHDKVHVEAVVATTQPENTCCSTCSAEGTPVPCSADLHVFWVGGPTNWGDPSAVPPWGQWGHEALMQRLAECHLGTAQPRLRRGCHPTSEIVTLLSLMWILARLASTPDPATVDKKAP